MLIPLADYRTFTGDVASADADVTVALTRAQQSVEGYLERNLESQAYTETHRFISHPALLLAQYPVTVLTSVTKDGTTLSVDDMILDAERGLLYHKGSALWGHEVSVTYTAGYATAPGDIKQVICALAEAHLAGTLSITGPESSRAVKKDTVYGVSAVEYDTAFVAKAELDFYPELGPYVRILDKYRRPYEVPRF